MKSFGTSSNINYLNWNKLRSISKRYVTLVQKIIKIVEDKLAFWNLSVHEGYTNLIIILSCTLSFILFACEENYSGFLKGFPYFEYWAKIMSYVLYYVLKDASKDFFISEEQRAW